MGHVPDCFNYEKECHCLRKRTVPLKEFFLTDCNHLTAFIHRRSGKSSLTFPNEPAQFQIVIIPSERISPSSLRSIRKSGTEILVTVTALLYAGCPSGTTSQQSYK
jgi:hypothetical protein